MLGNSAGFPSCTTATVQKQQPILRESTLHLGQLAPTCRVLKALRGGCSRGGGIWGTLRIPREDWGILGNIRRITTPLKNPITCLSFWAAVGIQERHCGSGHFPTRDWGWFNSLFCIPLDGCLEVLSTLVVSVLSLLNPQLKSQI